MCWLWHCINCLFVCLLNFLPYFLLYFIFYAQRSWPNRVSVRSQKDSLISIKIWYVGRGRWMMCDDMQYDPILGQGHEPFKVGNLTILKAISSPIYNGGWQMTTDSLIRAQYLKLIGAGFLIFCLSFCVTWLWSWQQVGVVHQSRTGLIYLLFIYFLTRLLPELSISIDFFQNRPIPFPVRRS